MVGLLLYVPSLPPLIDGTRLVVLPGAVLDVGSRSAPALSQPSVQRRHLAFGLPDGVLGVAAHVSGPFVHRACGGYGVMLRIGVAKACSRRKSPLPAAGEKTFGLQRPNLPMGSRTKEPAL